MGESVFTNPDGLGDKGRAALGAQTYITIEIARRELLNQKIANDHDDDDGVPSERSRSGFVEDKDGSIVTYGERTARLARAAGKIVEAHSDIRDEFEQAVKEQREQRFG